MIETITLRGYMGHTETVVPCQPLTVLIGENAAGKTSVLEGVATARDCLHDSLRNKSLRARKHRRAEGVSLRVDVSAGGGRASVSITMPSGKNYRTDIDAEFSLDGVVRRMAWTSSENDGLRADEWQFLVDAAFPRPTWLTLEPNQLARPSQPQSVNPRPDASGFGLASALAHLKLSDTVRFTRIVEHLRAVVPLVRDIRFQRMEQEKLIPRTVNVDGKQVEFQDKVPTIADALLFDFADASEVPAHLVSEGTLLTLGIMTMLEYEKGLSLLLIDDIDRALHPRAQRALVATLRAILAQQPNLQVLATSHSPYLIDAFSPEEVVLLGRNAENAIVAKRLDAFPDERLRKMLSSGELWMSQGDDWVGR